MRQLTLAEARRQQIEDVGAALSTAATRGG